MKRRRTTTPVFWLLSSLAALALASCGGPASGTFGGGELVSLDATGGARHDIGAFVDTPTATDAAAEDTAAGDATDDGADATSRDTGPPDTAADVPLGDGDGADTGLRDVRDGDVPSADTGWTDATDASRDVATSDVPAPDVPVRDEVAPPDPKTVRLATWNVHFFWDDVCQSGACDWGDFEEELTTAAFEARAADVAASIRGLGADAVCLQEIESQHGLDEIQANLGPEFPVVELGETGYPASLDVAIVSRGTLEELRDHRDHPIPLPGGGTTTFSRELMEAHLRVDGVPIVFFCAHFKSQHDDDAARRLAEAEAAHDIVVAAAQANPDALVVLAGDLNDVPGSPPLDALVEDGRLLRVARELPGDDDATYWYDGPRALDHLLLALDAGGDYVDGSATVLTDRPDRLEYGGSDHAALRAVFTWLP